MALQSKQGSYAWSAYNSAWYIISAIKCLLLSLCPIHREGGSEMWSHCVKQLGRWAQGHIWRPSPCVRFPRSLHHGPCCIKQQWNLKPRSKNWLSRRWLVTGSNESTFRTAVFPYIKWEDWLSHQVIPEGLSRAGISRDTVTLTTTWGRQGSKSWPQFSTEETETRKQVLSRSSCDVTPPQPKDGMHKGRRTPGSQCPRPAPSLHSAASRGLLSPRCHPRSPIAGPANSVLKTATPD